LVAGCLVARLNLRQFPAKYLALVGCSSFRQSHIRVMARFFFHFQSGLEHVQDEEGLLVADAASARACAITMLRDILAGDILAGKLDCAATIKIENEERDTIGEISMADALTIV